ncbi:MAG: choice-of-anchor Q domain-containing protein [Thermoleophilia bacterium]
MAVRSPARPWLAAAAALVLAAGLAGCGSDTADAPQETAPPEPAAPQWFVAPSGSDIGAGTREDPFATMAAAHAVAADGDIVEMAGGDYPVQRWSEPSAGPGEPVVFVPAPGAVVRLAYLQLDDVDDVEFRDLRTEGWYIGPGSQRVTLQGVRSSVNGNFITSARDVLIQGGEIGPVDSSDGIQVKVAEGGVQPARITIDGVRMHDITRREDPDSHVDCVQFGAGRDVVVRRSRFDRCATQGVFLRPFGGGVIEDVLIENNWFGLVIEGFSGLVVDEDVGPGAGIVVRYNSSVAGMRVEPAGARMTANVGPLQSFACVPGVVYRHNVWSEASCDPTDQTAALGFADPSGPDPVLVPGAAAIDAGDPADHPDTDIDGRTRPMGSAPDAGASEAAPG